jgi:hypothetical protein
MEQARYYWDPSSRRRGWLSILAIYFPNGRTAFLRDGGSLLKLTPK